MNIKTNKIWVFVCIFIILFFSNGLIKNAAADKVQELNKEIESRKSNIGNLNEKIKIYKEKIEETRQEGLSLKNELSILENQIAKISLDIKITTNQIQKTNLEIQTINISINKTEKDIENNKKRLANFIALINNNDKVSYLEILLMHDSFSDFFDHYKYLREINRDIHLVLQRMKNLKNELEIQKNNLEAKKADEIAFKTELENIKKDQEETKERKNILLAASENSEKQFQNYVRQLQLEQQQINSAIMALEKKVREELEKRAQEEKFKNFGKPGLQWPTDSRYITARFHDPDYPFRYIFEHPAIDIRAAQGTPVRSAEAGYVAMAKNGGAKGYSYIMIIHNDGLSTVYGHVSRIDVKQDQYVTKGQVIGLSGGQPGTPGAGNLTTGPHLHFEVRLNGIPVNPLEYLPRDW